MILVLAALGVGAIPILSVITTILDRNRDG